MERSRREFLKSDDYQMNAIGFRQKLTIYKLHPDDSGKYFCRVNDIETSAWLTVTRKYFGLDGEKRFNRVYF